MNTDRIEKNIVLHAPLARVWRAISDANEFGHWFGMKLSGAFTPGARLSGVITPTQVDPEVAAAQQPHGHRSQQHGRLAQRAPGRVRAGRPGVAIA